IGSGNTCRHLSPATLPNPCGDVGACCLANNQCSVLTRSACTAQGGTFNGAPDCGNNTTYDPSNCNTPMDDISQTGTIAAGASGTDDGAALGVPIGFSFPFFETTQTTITISNNGFLTFDPSVTGGFFVNGPIPDPGAPNSMIAPLWDDLYSVTQGDVKYQ